MTVYTESFETGFGDWSNDTSATGSWTRNSGGTPSGGTGPSSASDGTYYLYIEGSDGSFEARLEFDLTLSPDSEITFDYHIHTSGGGAVGYLTLEGLVNSNWIPFWAVAGDQGSGWNTASQVKLPEGATSVRFVSGSGEDFQPDIAIDNITLEDGLSFSYEDYSNTTNTITESFEGSGSGGLTNFTVTQEPTAGILTITSGDTPSGTTGPSGANDGTYYIYSESTDISVADGATERYILTLDPTLNGNGGLISFDEHRNGTAIDFIVLEYSTDNGSTWDVLWARGGETGTSWNVVPEFPYPSGTTGLRFVWWFSEHDSFRGDLALDNIVIKEAGSAGTTIESSLTLSSNYSLSSSATASFEASSTLAHSQSVSATATGTFEVSLTLPQSQGLGASADATLEGSLTLAQAQQVSATSTVAIESAVTLGMDAQATTSALAALEASATLAQTQQLASTSQIQGQAEASLSLDMSHALTTTAQADIEAALTLAQSAGVTTTGGNEISAALSLALTSTQATSADITIEGAVSLGLDASLATQAQADMEASSALGLTAALSIIADAVLDAGLTLDAVQSITTDGETIVAGLTAPDGRIFTVTARTRSFDVSGRSRTFTVN